MVERQIDLVVVHCSATPAIMDIGVKEIRGWHLERGWRDIGYHYVIRRSGEIEYGRDVEEQGAHVKGHNETSIGICLVGGTNADDKSKGECNYTKEQFAWLEQILLALGKRYPQAQICGHRDLDPHKACPCFNVRDWWGSDVLSLAS